MKTKRKIKGEKDKNGENEREREVEKMEIPQINKPVRAPAGRQHSKLYFNKTLKKKNNQQSAGKPAQFTQTTSKVRLQRAQEAGQS